MATRGAANRGGGPATFVGGVRRFKLSWEEAELPVFGPSIVGSGAARKMRLLRWVRTDERTDDADNAVPRHPNLVPVDDASIPFKSPERNAPAPADTAAAATATTAATPASATAGTGASAAPAAAANGTETGAAAADAPTTATTTAEAPMETS